MSRKKEKELPEMQIINDLQITVNGQVVGRLALTPDGLCAFEYAPEFLVNGFSIAPFYLPLEKKVFIAKHHPFHGNFGVFNDSLPDGWGNLLLDRFLTRKNRNVDQITQLQRLALIGTTGRGALEYRPETPIDMDSRETNIEQLAQDVAKVLGTIENEEALNRLYQKGGSSGGARPKVFIKRDGEEWLVKFKAQSDMKNVGEIEYQYALLAQKCNIDMEEVRLFEGKYFGVKRFDRSKGEKIHTLSAAGLLQADYRVPSLDYEMLLNACFLLTKDMSEVLKLFRIMVFNVLIENKDDHAKNFSFQYKNNKWLLSPAYDLLPSDGFNGYHTTTVNGNGHPQQGDITSVADKVGLNPRRVRCIIEELEEVCKKKLK